MIKYICRNCNDLETETSICPVCGKRANLLSSEIYYCKKCNAPSFTEQCPECNSICEKIGSDMRPVFAKERLLLEVFLNKPMEFAGKSVWASGSNFYWVDGDRIKINVSELRKRDPSLIIEELKKYDDANQVYVENDTTNHHMTYYFLDIKNDINHLKEWALNGGLS